MAGVGMPRARPASMIPAVVGQALLGVVEHAAKGSIGIEVKPRHGDFLDAQPGRAACTHSCSGMPQPVSRMCSRSQGLAAIRLEAAKRVGQVQTETVVQLRRVICWLMRRRSCGASVSWRKSRR